MKGKTMKKLIALFSVVALAFVAAGCLGTSSDSDVAAKNLSKAAEQFEVPRRIIFINGITDKYLFEIDGYCSIDPAGAGLRALAVTCKLGEGKFKKSYLGLSDNVTWMVEQIDSIDVSTTHYRVIFKPESIVPNFDRP